MARTSPNRHRNHSRSRDDYHRSRSCDRQGRHRSLSRQSQPRSTLAECGRDRRTVFIQQLAAGLSEPELKEFISKAGKVRHVKIVTDKITGRSRGFGYVEFSDETSVPVATMMSGEKLRGIPLLISRTESERNRLSLEISGDSRKPNSRPEYKRLHVESVHPKISESDLRKIFEPFGRIESLALNLDPVTRQSKGSAHVQYQYHRDAKRALVQLDGLELAGINIRVTAILDRNRSIDIY